MENTIEIKLLPDTELLLDNILIDTEMSRSEFVQRMIERCIGGISDEDIEEIDAKAKGKIKMLSDAYRKQYETVRALSIFV